MMGPQHPLIASFRIIAILNDMRAEDREETIELVTAYAALRHHNGDLEAAKKELLGDGAQRSAAALDRARALEQRGFKVRESHG
jgi:hypothetical protein